MLGVPRGTPYFRIVRSPIPIAKSTGVQNGKKTSWQMAMTSNWGCLKIEYTEHTPKSDV